MRHSRYDILLKVVECGSFSAAAEQLGYTQSAISQTIAALEQELGVTLLVRNKKGTRLSTDGRACLPHIREICGTVLRLFWAGSADISASGPLPASPAIISPGSFGPFKKSTRPLPFSFCRGTMPKLRAGFWRGRWISAFAVCPWRHSWTPFRCAKSG